MSRITLVGLLTLTAVAFSCVAGATSTTEPQNPLTGTVILRVDTTTQAMTMLSTDNQIKNQSDAQSLVQDESKFKPVDKSANRTELDRDGATSSWYFCWPYYYSYYYPYNYYYSYPTYYYYGYNYFPYYNWGWGHYHYYYYGRRW